MGRLCSQFSAGVVYRSELEVSNMLVDVWPGKLEKSKLWMYCVRYIGGWASRIGMLVWT